MLTAGDCGALGVLGGDVLGGNGLGDGVLGGSVLGGGVLDGGVLGGGAVSLRTGSIEGSASTRAGGACSSGDEGVAVLALGASGHVKEEPGVRITLRPPLSKRIRPSCNTT